MTCGLQVHVHRYQVSWLHPIETVRFAPFDWEELLGN